MKNPDVIIIGSGIGGLITGALLAKEDGLKVLVLEKNPQIGGRVMSFGGHYGTYTEKEYRHLLWESGAKSRIFKTEPSLTEIIDKKGLFTNYVTDIAWHTVSAGNRCRYSTLARAMSKEIRVSPSIGFFYYQDGKWVEMQDLLKEWPKEAVIEKNRVARERMTLTNEDSALYDDVDIKTYLESMCSDKRVVDYYLPLALFQFGPNNPADISAGEWIRCNNSTSAVGGNVSSGGGIGTCVGGFQMIANVYADIIRECDGDVRTNAKVKEVIVEQYKATGVVVEQNGKTSTIKASTVVSNLPVDTTNSILDRKYIPKVMQEKIDKVEGMGGIFVQLAVKELLETKYPKAMYVLPELPSPELEGGIKPLFTFEQTSAIDPTRRLNKNACHLISGWLGGLSARNPDQRHDQKWVNETLEQTFIFLRKQYPNFDENLDWYICTVCERVYSILYAPGLSGNFHFNVKHPVVNGLYFTGEGVISSDIGSNATAIGAIHCANAISGKNHLKLLPPAMR